MDIPSWVEKGKRTDRQRASARLKYVMMTMASRHTPRHSIRGLAELVGMNHSTLSIYIRRGECSAAAAQRIVEKLNDSGLTTTMLTDPMSIPKAPG